MTKIVRRYTSKLRPYVPALIRENWITLLSLVLVVWLTYTSVELYRTAHEAKKASIASRHLAVENQHRITEIQKQRVRSCQLTYQSIYDVFQPFFPKRGTPQQEANQAKFNRIVKHKKRGCTEQVLRKPRNINPPQLRIH